MSRHPADPPLPGRPPAPAPPVAPWGSLIRDPRCTLTVGAPGAAVIALLAEELRHRRLRVRVDPTGRALYAKPRWPLVMNVVALAAGAGDGLATPSLRARVVGDGVDGSSVLVWTRNVGWVSGAGGRFPDALNAVAMRFIHAGAAFAASPWERTPASWNWRETFEDMV